MLPGDAPSLVLSGPRSHLSLFGDRARCCT